ncbi:uncharacterized protein [Gossypium hirsutum]|uniref:DNA/RNA polymerases superfamily protein n=1 Tax=Gossypium hirsutum TaxID=3635 RepID=A0ABM2ZAP8_GOSHI|nr:uncharacterized protein LOC121211046 [Gossypium hirsutum]
MDDLDCTPKQKLKGAVSLLHNEAYQRWLTVKEGTQPDCLTWEFFKTSFQSKYVGTNYIDARRLWDYLRGNLGVLIAPQREREFFVLVEKAKIVEDVKHSECQNRDRERDKNKSDAEPSSSVQRLKKRNYRRRHPGECWRRIEACLSCGSLKHRIRECPQQRTPARSAGQIDARQHTLVYVTRRRENRDAPNVITGTFFIFDVPYVALIDVGSTHLYIASTVSETLGIFVESTTSEVTVLSPLGQSVWVSKLYKDVPLDVQGTIFLANLMELPFREFDLILGMDWLVGYRVSLDYASKRIILRTNDDVEVVMIGECRDYLSHLISTLVVKRLVRKWCDVCLAYKSIFDSRDSFVGNIKTVKDFLDIFPEELPGLPPIREVELGIKLLLGTVSVSIALYHMAPKELIKLKAQL